MVVAGAVDRYRADGASPAACDHFAAAEAKTVAGGAARPRRIKAATARRRIGARRRQAAGACTGLGSAATPARGLAGSVQQKTRRGSGEVAAGEKIMITNG